MKLVSIIITVFNLCTSFNNSFAITKEWYLQGYRMTMMKHSIASTRFLTKAALSSKKNGKGMRSRKMAGKGLHPSKGPVKGMLSSVTEGKGMYSSKAPGKGMYSSKAPGKGMHSSNAPGKGMRSSKAPGKGKGSATSTSEKNQSSTIASIPKGPKSVEPDASEKDTYQLNGVQSSVEKAVDTSGAYYSRPNIGCSVLYTLMIISFVATTVF